jgi:CRISPR-associated endonuclease Csn1
MLTAAAKLQEKEQAWRSMGETFWNDPELRLRKRNRDGDFSRTVLRTDLEHEVRLLLQTQRKQGNALASEALETEFLEVAFFQRPLADSEDKVGPCPFEAEQKRAARYAPSFEMFRLLARLTSLRVAGRPLTAEELAAATRDFGHQQGMTYSRLRKLLALSAVERFDGISPDDEGKRDVVARSGKAMPGSAALRKVFGEGGWDALRKTPDKLDRIAAVLTFREDVASTRSGLDELGLDAPILDSLMKGVEDGAFAAFKGAGHISAKACRAIIPYMAQGMVYSEACNQIPGYIHAKQPETDLDSIANPIARKALGEALKQVNAVIRVYGKPTHIHVELARDIGKSPDERQEIERGIEKRNRDKDKLRQQYRDTVGGEPNAEDLMRFELWKEQGGRSLYSDRDIHPSLIASSGNEVQVDHILPWSRSGDDSFVNKTLCFTTENQKKKGRSPHDWFADDGLDWPAFAARVENSKEMKGRKKRNYLLKNASVLEEKFRSRNLNDTRYACRLLLSRLERDYNTVMVAARPGPLTDRLRRAWGLQGLKKNQQGERIADDRHHALDAVIVALTSESMLQRLTKLFQAAEARGFPTDWHGIGHLRELLRDSGGAPGEFSALEPPWPSFRHDVISALAGITVSRAERRRARGAAHAATIRQVSERDGQPVVYERKAVAALTEKDLDRVKDADRNHRIVDVLRQWIVDGKPQDSLPVSPQGHIMRKVRLATNKKVDVEVRGGAADRGEMARVDVFRRANKKGKWEFYLVPVYPHQVATLSQPPNSAVVAHKNEADWPEMIDGHEFLWSMYPLSWVQAVKPNGEIIEGYFQGMDRSTGAIAISAHHSKTAISRGIGAKTLASLRKFAVDRLGTRSEIEREIRTWHGRECI